MRERDTQPARRWDEVRAIGLRRHRAYGLTQTACGRPQTKIRIKFADRTIVQQAFPSTAPLKDVYAFVRASLAPAHVEAKFTLCASPFDSKICRLRCNADSCRYT